MIEALIGFAAIFGLALLRVPLAFSMGLVGLVGIGVTRGWMPALASTAQVVYETGFAYTLSVIPLFILMGHFATQGGISKALFEFAAGVMGRLKGGLAMGAVLWAGQGLVMPYVHGTWTIRVAAMAALVTSGVVVYGLAAVLTGAFRVDDLKLLLRRRRSN